MKKSLFDSDRLIFAGQTCLVASILMGIVLVVRASYAPTPVIATAISSQTAFSATVPAASRQTVPAVAPSFAPNVIFQLHIEVTSNQQRKQANAFSVQWTDSKRYLVSHASVLPQSGWEQGPRISITQHGNKSIVPVQMKPLYLGPYSEDHQPNLLLSPDLSFDLVVWPMPAHVTGQGLILASQNACPGENVWIMACPDKNTNAQSHFHCRVMEQSENALAIQPIDRVSLEMVIGLPVVNQLGAIIGNVLGGNDLTLIGASSQGLIRRLTGIENK